MTDAPCARCHRVQANDRMYWYAMGRLREIASLRRPTDDELARAMPVNVCWSSVTAHYDGPNGVEWLWASKDCEKFGGTP